MKAEIEDWMIAEGCLRNTLVIGFGGGVVGDLAGYVAATFMRGVAFVQVPTTLLAMVDSSIGGKTAIDVPGGKNLVGAFKQPKAIFADVDVLQTLPIRELRCGMAEAMKHGLIFDASVFEAIRTHFPQIEAKDPATLLEIVSNAMRIKSEVVTLDECEGGIRACLNFGHTVGHAVEALSPWLQHGECVGIGMVVEVRVARALGLCDDATVDVVTAAVTKSGLPFEVPFTNDMEELFQKMSKDKKNTGKESGAKCVLLTSVGAVKVEGSSYAHSVEGSVLRAAIAASRAAAPTAAEEQ